MDDVRIYNRILSASEVTQLYNIGASKMAVSRTLSPLKSGLVGWWTFDGPNMVNNVTDSSGQGNTGFMNGFTSTSSAQIPGKIGQALSFDGVNSRVLTGSDFIGTSDVTVTAWIFPRSSGGSALGEIINNGKFLFYTRGSSQNLAFKAQDSTLSQSANNSITYGTWQFVSVTRSGTTVNLYVNGVLSGTANQTNDAPLAGSTNVFIGNRNGNAEGFDGYIDDLRVYNRVLSTSEVSQLYNLGR
jgi:hypothetical protein